MRVIGLSWTDWKTPWSSSTDENYVGTVGQLRKHLEEVLEEESNLHRRGELPSKEEALAAECPAPQFRRKSFKSLGTPTVQAAELADDKVDISPEEVLAAALERRRELEAQGEIDWVSDRQPYPTGQGPVPNKALIGKKIEVRWRYRHVTTGEPVYIWCEGEVVQVSIISDWKILHAHLIRVVLTPTIHTLLVCRWLTAKRTGQRSDAKRFCPLVRFR